MATITVEGLGQVEIAGETPNAQEIEAISKALETSSYSEESILSIEEYKKQNPEFASIPDLELAESLYKKHKGKINETDFYKIALEPPIRHNGSLIFNKTYSVKIFGGDVNYVHHQNNAATSWNINHNLGKFPSVTIKFSTGATYSNVGAFAGVTYTDKNNLTINLAAAQSGYAYLN